MASITTTPEHTYRVRYRDPTNHSRSRTFKRKSLAREFMAGVETDKARGEFVDPCLANGTVLDYAQEWAEILTVKPKTRRVYIGALNNWVMPYLAEYPVAALNKPMIKSWANKLVDEYEASEHNRAQAICSLRLVLNHALERGAIRVNPAVGLRMPKKKKTEMRFLTVEEVKLLAKIIHLEPNLGYDTLILFAAFTGCRAGEIEALKVKDVDLKIRTATIRASMGEDGVVGTTKTDRIRSVSIPKFLADRLWWQLLNRDPDDHVWTAPGGGPIIHSNFYSRVFKPAVLAAGLNPNLRFHDLRHTCAALLIKLGAHPRAIMERLGHSSITVTLNTYGHLFPELEEKLTRGMEELWGE